jgi:hypothetical protein
VLKILLIGLTLSSKASKLYPQAHLRMSGYDPGCENAALHVIHAMGFRPCYRFTVMSALPLPAQPIDATQALNLSAGVSNCKVSRGRSLS